MRHRHAAVVSAIAVAMWLSGCGGDQGSASHRGTDGGHGSEHDTSVDANHADLTFAMRMLPRDRQAVEMSGIVLETPGVDPDVTAMARQVRQTQLSRLDLLVGWLNDWQSSTNTGMDGMGGMQTGAMLDEAEMTRLRESAGPVAERIFLAGMVEHHEDALAAAEDELVDGAFDPARELAQSVIDTHPAELDQLRALLN